jgi:hypothetical protein
MCSIKTTKIDMMGMRLHGIFLELLTAATGGWFDGLQGAAT